MSPKNCLILCENFNGFKIILQYQAKDELLVSIPLNT